MGGQDSREAEAVCRHDRARLYPRAQRRGFPLLPQSERIVVDAFVPSDLVAFRRTGELRGTRTCGEPADPRARVPRERHERAFHIAAVVLGRGHRVDARAAARNDSVRTADVRRGSGPLHRRQRHDRGPARFRRQNSGLRPVRGGTHPPVGHGRPHGKLRDHDVHTRVRVERDPALFPRRSHRQGNRRADTGPVGR